MDDYKKIPFDDPDLCVPDLDEIVWDQINVEYEIIKSDSHRGLSDVKDAKAKQAVRVNDDREADATALDVQEK